MLDGHRLLLYSGEFHYFRLPSQALWRDRLEKIKAAGLNAISIYFDWQYHSWAPGQYDFSGVRDIDALLNLAQSLGLYVIARVGPYMNAEVDAGGLPGWVLTKALYPRSQSWNGTTAAAEYSALYSQYSREWYDHLLPILARHQVTNNGPVVLLSIENEYSQPNGSEQYMRDLYESARSNGIQVPIFHNDYEFKGDWSKVVDLYAFDSYPYGFNCCHGWGEVHFHGIDGWESYLRNTLKITTPIFVSELQAGSYDPWGGQGYDKIAQTLDGSWLNVLDGAALSQGTSILNSYMFAGGTSWGYMSEPGVYTSYDYGAPIAEDGTLRPSYYAAHRIASFLQSFGPSLAASDPAPAPVVIGQGMVAHARVDPGTGTRYIFLRHGDAGDPSPVHLQLAVGSTTVAVPQKPGTDLTVPGHGAAILVANADVGPLHLNYSTSQILGIRETSQGTYLVLYGPQDTSGETDFVLPSGSVAVEHNFGVTVTRQNGELRLNYRHTADPRIVLIRTPSGTLRLLITAEQQASRYWFVQHAIVAGPDLVVDAGHSLQASCSAPCPTIVYGANGQLLAKVDGESAAPPDAFAGAMQLGTLSGPSAFNPPHFSNWRFAEASPEVNPAFDDSQWLVADHTTTSNPNVPATSGLLADDYGFHYGYVWYRGHFTASGAETGLTIAARHSFSVYLNGQYLGGGDASTQPPPHVYATPITFTFPSGAVRQGADNVIAVLTESLGHDEGWLAGPLAQSPMGILSAQLTGQSTPITWRIKGAAGGENPADRTRGLLNASGLVGEREGWNMPGFNDSSWEFVGMPDDWHNRSENTAVGWYRTHFSLNSRNPTSLSLVLPHVSDKAVIWLNGWLIGRYWEQQGPQHAFYLPQGILNEGGDNLLSIAVWNRGHDGGLTATPQIQEDGAFQVHDITLDNGDPPSGGYWHTSGNRILDAQGRPIRIAAVNWSGMQNTQFVPAGLDHQPLDSITKLVASMGFNTIRLPFSNQMVEQNPVITQHLQANPQLKGLHALDILDRIIASAGKAGLRVILEDHRSDAGGDPEDNGLWYNRRYPEKNWIADWQKLAARYKGNPTLVGVDLRDEPHTAPPGPWSINTYLHQGATWGPYRGIENTATDWRLGAQRGGNAVLKINPHLLVIVEGLQQYPDSTQPGGIDSYWWGGVFQPAMSFPLALNVSHQLVYSPHEYGPVKFNMNFFGPSMSYNSMVRVWQRHWGFLEQASYKAQAPIFIGEFGTCATSTTCVQDNRPGSQGLWFSFFTRYMKEHPEIGWAFWALNGTSPTGQDQPNYILKSDWRSPRLHQLLDTLREIEGAPPPA